MAKKKSSVKGITTDIKKILKEYGEDVLNKFSKAASKNAEVFTNKLRNTKQPPASSRGSAHMMKRREWKRYSEGWNWKGNEYNSTFSVVIYNKDHYRLTHLLEYGHETRNGKDTRAFEHIKPIADEFYEAYLKEVEKDD